MSTLTRQQRRAYTLRCNGHSPTVIAQRMGIARQRVYQLLGVAKKKGFDYQKGEP